MIIPPWLIAVAAFCALPGPALADARKQNPDFPIELLESTCRIEVTLTANVKQEMSEFRQSEEHPDGYEYRQTIFFGGPREHIGSGFIAERAGHLVTNAHVLGALSVHSLLGEDEEIDLNQYSTEKLKIEAIFRWPKISCLASWTITAKDRGNLFKIGAEYEISDLKGCASGIKCAEKDDLCLVKIPNTGLPPPLPLAPNDILGLSETVHTINRPVINLKQRITAKVIDHHEIPGCSYAGLMSYDFQINKGTSGSPVANDKGEVIGINRALCKKGELSYFVPVGKLRKLLE